MSLKLVGRLRCCCQLEALLDALLEVGRLSKCLTDAALQQIKPCACRELHHTCRANPSDRCCCLFPARLQHAPPLFSLPALANTLESSMGTSVLVAAKKAGGAKASGKGGKGGKKKKQGVKFEEDAPSPGGSGHDANTSQQTHSGRSNGSVPQASSGSTQAGDPGAPRGVAGTGAGGQPRLEAERWKQRSLLLPALAALEVGAGPHQENFCYGMLPSAAYLLADLHGKLKTVLAAAKRSSCFPGRAAKQQLAAGKCTESLLGQPVLPAHPAAARACCSACCATCLQVRSPVPPFGAPMAAVLQIWETSRRHSCCRRFLRRSFLRCGFTSMLLAPSYITR